MREFDFYIRTGIFIVFSYFIGLYMFNIAFSPYHFISPRFSLIDSQFKMFISGVFFLLIFFSVIKKITIDFAFYHFFSYLEHKKRIYLTIISSMALFLLEIIFCFIIFNTYNREVFLFSPGKFFSSFIWLGITVFTINLLLLFYIHSFLKKIISLISNDDKIFYYMFMFEEINDIKANGENNETENRKTELNELIKQQLKNFIENLKFLIYFSILLIVMVWSILNGFRVLNQTPIQITYKAENTKKTIKGVPLSNSNNKICIVPLETNIDFCLPKNNILNVQIIKKFKNQGTIDE